MTETLSLSCSVLTRLLCEQIPPVHTERHCDFMSSRVRSKQCLSSAVTRPHSNEESGRPWVHALHAASLDDRIILRNYGCSVAERFTGDREVTVSSSKSGSIAFSCLSLSEDYGFSLQSFGSKGKLCLRGEQALAWQIVFVARAKNLKTPLSVRFT